ncbi:MAG: competence/damage-inducible protein A [Bacteroidetes bacterium]|nr:competence/damage-inducible protein A [Bacteroidota bacterium]
MTAVIITIGDELLIGQIINTNQAYIAERLNTVGVDCRRMLTVGDNAADVLAAFEEGLRTAEVVCVTGGLGPTHDDITKRMVCEFFGTDLVMHEPTLEHIKVLATRRNIAMLQSNIDQALVPRTCTVIPNPVGTAPGMLFEKDGRYFFVMPGVPYEMKEMVDHWILPFLEQRNNGMVVRHRTLKTTGIGESMLANEIGPVEQIIGTDGSITLAFLPNPMGTKLRLTVKDPSAASAQQKLEAAEAALRARTERYIYSDDEKELEDVIGLLLTQRKATLSVAESCTGGLLANRITNVPGSSAYFLGGFIAYHNDVKMKELGVPASVLEQHGAVSKETAEAMAIGARTALGTDVALSVTGIAGPSGGTPEKPVGLCFIGYADADSSFAMKFNFGDNRKRFKDRATQAALELLRRKLLKMN